MAGLYPEELIEEIRIRTDIYELIGEYVRLEKKGKYYFGLCPFHKEKTASFSVTPEKQIFHCYGCGESGNVFHFVMKMENFSFVEAVKFLADRAKIALPEQDNSPEELKKIALKKELLNLNIEAARYYHANLVSDKGMKALEYLKKRGIENRTINSFGLGYSLEAWDDLQKHLERKGFSRELMLKGGYIIRGRENSYYDRFRGRLMFPIFDVRGNVIGFGGRVLDDSLPKYMNSPETILYSKSKNLYALNFAKNASQKAIIVVEGYMDAMTLHQWGITNVVASLGTAMTGSQGRILKKYAEEIIIAYDSDTAGQAATMRGLDMLYDIGCSVRVVTLPRGKDPDEFVRNNGKDEFLKLVESALPLIEYKVLQAKAGINTESTKGKIEFLNKSADILAKVANDVEREVYIRKISKDTGIAPESFYSEIMKRKKPAGRRIKNGQSRMKIVERSPAGAFGREHKAVANAERILLWLMSRNSTNYDRVFKEIGVEGFSSGCARKIAGIIINRMENNKGVDLGEILNFLEDRDEVRYLAEIIDADYDFEDEGKALEDALNRIKVAGIEKRMKEILFILNSNSDERDVEKLNGELSLLIMEKKRMESKNLH
jgi:DNA primase